MLALHLGGGGGVTTEIMVQTFIYSCLYLSLALSKIKKLYVREE